MVEERHSKQAPPTPADDDEARPPPLAPRPPPPAPRATRDDYVCVTTIAKTPFFFVATRLRRHFQPLIICWKIAGGKITVPRLSTTPALLWESKSEKTKKTARFMVIETLYRHVIYTHLKLTQPQPCARCSWMVIAGYRVGCDPCFSVTP